MAAAVVSASATASDNSASARPSASSVHPIIAASHAGGFSMAVDFVPSSAKSSPRSGADSARAQPSAVVQGARTVAELQQGALNSARARSAKRSAQADSIAEKVVKDFDSWILKLKIIKQKTIESTSGLKFAKIFMAYSELLLLEKTFL